MPLALIRFMIPCTEDSRKLSDPAFISSRCMPTMLGLRSMMSKAMKSLRVVLASTIAVMSVCGTSE